LEQLRWDELRDTLERQLKDAQTLNSNLQAELAKVRSVNTESERNLRSQLEDTRSDHAALEAELMQSRAAASEIDYLKKELEQARSQPMARGFADDGGQWRERYENTAQELAMQQHTTEEVRREAAEALQEIRSISQRGTETVEREERLLDQVSSLEREVREWKTRYTRSKAQSRSLRASSLGLPTVNGNAPEFADSAFLTPDGVIKDFHLTKFQQAVDELLQNARRPESEPIHDSMKHVVMAVRSISSDMEAAASSGPNEPTKQIKLKTRLSHAANNLITVSKAHASAAGIAPVSLVDAASSHLTNAVVDAVKALKIRVSTPEEQEAEDFSEAATKPAALVARAKGSFSDSSRGSVHLRNASMSSGYSTYSRYSSRYSNNTSPPQLSGEIKGLGINQSMGMLRENGIEEFKNYLEDSTAVLVRSIQPLVNTIRSSPNGGAQNTGMIADYVREIDATVQDIVSKTSTAVKDLNNSALAKHAPPVTKILDSTRLDLMKRQETGDRDSIPPIAFKVARATKVSTTTSVGEMSIC
jgi:hypothetical protein